MNFLSTLKETPVIIVAGTGGVGKTTTSCGIAISLAQIYSAKILVITIDPAKRLAKVLIEENLSHDPKRIDYRKFIGNEEPLGEVYAAMVDTSEGWKKIVERYSKSDKDSKRIFENNLYSNLTTRFSHSHDFAAMDSLYEHYRSGEYDYIVLDTPPTSQAFGFFDAPQAMSDFFGGKLVKLITSPYRLGNGRAAKLFDLASQPFFALADKVLGKDFLNDIGEFFFLFHTMYDDFVERSKSITQFLTSNKVQAILVIDSAQFISKTYEQMSDGLLKRNIDLESILINKVPFTGEKDKEIIDYIENIDRRDMSYIEALMASDLEISKDLSEELHRPQRAHRELREQPQIPVGIVPRIVEIDMVARISALVETIQDLELMDDTI